ncbi:MULTISPECIES: oxygenase MpaB family protein [unclassified Sphingomonas]|uniref:oxygenase MpaB family protein n=1 Tax=unclassified Sphingomonas TaxID=196159 RepID=UPI0022B55C61|nr:oxygenase MpaB family protein [Sphingomonas sp. NIBR02145]WHU01943.1 oxygenase MpaB family protein [Sphingomonas sp. NIBR02145]
MTPADGIANRLRTALIGQVRAVFNDQARGEKPVQRKPDESLFGPRSVVWRVHGDVTTMMVGGVAALLLQMLHPAVLAGVWDHSTFRGDMLGRLRRTARFIAVTTYGSAAEAQEMIDKVRDVHTRVKGVLPDGTPYAADDPHLLAWVHVTEAVSFLDAWIRYAEPGMSLADQDRYFADFARIAEALGAVRIPRRRADADNFIAEMRPELLVDARTREVARMVLDQPAPSMAVKPFQALTFGAAVDLLPDWARTMHGLSSAGLATPAVRIGTRGVASTLRWAFR